MSRIKITESDYTVPVATYNTTDVVFVPGFSIAPIGTGNVARMGEPKLCQSLAEFNAYFGSQAPIFATDQNYPSGFDSTATDGLTTNVWFAAGSPDPSYVYAKELLANGIAVIYERMNQGITSSDITVENAYARLADTVFSASRSLPITYPDATAFSTSATYSAGDKVIYEEHPYEAKHDISTAGEWNSDDWDQLPESEEIEQPLLDLAIPVKYLTSGGYPTLEYGGLAGLMISIAKSPTEGGADGSGRGDCVALIDYLDNNTRRLVGRNSIYDAFKTYDSEFAAAFVPWIQVHFTQVYYNGTEMIDMSNYHMPPSFAYLTALASTLSFASNTQAIAGVSRGQIPNLVSLCTNYNLTNTIAEDVFQPDSESASINGITYITNYGYRIWGNRTLKQNSGGTKATSFLNIRNIVSDVKKAVYRAATLTLFEPNVQATWLSFTSKLTPLLDTMISNYGITRYTLERRMVQRDGSPLPKTVLSAVLTIYPVYSIEKITVNIALRDDDTIEVSE